MDRILAFAAVFSQTGPGVTPNEVDAIYKRVQESVPAGAAILVMTDHPYLFDWRRNRVFLDDLPGSVGPHGGPPDFQGPEALSRYLHGLGIRYVAYMFGASSPEYSWDVWRPRFDAPPSPTGRGDFLKNMARFEVDFFKSLEALKGSRKTVYREGEMTVLDLDTPAT
jgi:hypothetical protein